MFPRNSIEGIKALFLYNNIFCLIRKSDGASCEKAVEELKSEFEIDDKYLSEDNVSGYFEYIYLRKTKTN